MSLGIGIDFGTIHSTLAYFDGDEATVLADNIPLALELVGRGANATWKLVEWDMLEDLPERPCVAAAKRLLEYRCSRALAVRRETGWFFKKLRLDIRGLLSKALRIRLGDEQYYTPDDICTSILSQLKIEAEFHLDDSVDRCAIGVPACSTSAYHQLLRQSAVKAGFNWVELVSELEAASLDLMRFLTNRERYVLIFDMGGTSAQAAILSVENQRKSPFSILAERRDNSLGGWQLDTRLIEHIIGEIDQGKGTNLFARSMAFRSRVARAREELSKKKTCRVKTGDAKEYRLSRSQVEQMFKEDESRVHALVDQVLEQASLDDSEVDRVFLIGGLAHTPFLQNTFHERFRDKVIVADSPRQCVARGCAIWLRRWETNLLAGVSATRPLRFSGFIADDEKWLQREFCGSSSASFPAGASELPLNQLEYTRYVRQYSNEFGICLKEARLMQLAASYAVSLSAQEEILAIIWRYVISSFGQEEIVAALLEYTKYMRQYSAVNSEELSEEVGLEIWVMSVKSPQGYYLTTTRGIVGFECKGIFLLDSELQDNLRRLEAGEADKQLLAELGKALFDSLFHKDVKDAYRSYCGWVRSHGRLRLRLRIEPPEMAALPWEYLCDPLDNSFLSISPRRVLTRYISLPKLVESLAVEGPLRILLAISSPEDKPPLDVDREIERISEALAELEKEGRITLNILKHASSTSIRQRLRTFHPHVFHFIGHGEFKDGAGWILLEDEKGQCRPIEDQAFAEFFDHKYTRLVVLNACESGVVGLTRTMAGMAPRLMRRGVLAVVGMQYKILDNVAITFSQEFYCSVVAGYPVDVAIAEARRAIYQDYGPEERDWGIPVLFMRSKDGHLFYPPGHQRALF